MVFYHPVKINWYHLWVVPISLACPFLITFSSDCLFHSFPVLTGYHLIKYEMITDNPFKSKCGKLRDHWQRQSFWFSVWNSSHRDGVMESKFNQIFHKVAWSTQQFLGSQRPHRIQRTIVQPWQAVDCQDVIECNDTPGASTYFWQVIRGGEKSENRPKEWSQSYNQKHRLHVPQWKEARNTKTAWNRRLKLFSMYSFNKWYGNLKIKYWICSFVVTFYWSKAMLWLSTY